MSCALMSSLTTKIVVLATVEIQHVGGHKSNVARRLNRRVIALNELYSSIFSAQLFRVTIQTSILSSLAGQRLNCYFRCQVNVTVLFSCLHQSALYK